MVSQVSLYESPEGLVKAFNMDFYNEYIGSYLDMDPELYTFDSETQRLVLVRSGDDITSVEQERLKRFMAPYFDPTKKPDFAKYFKKYTVKGDEIQITLVKQLKD